MSDARLGVGIRPRRILTILARFGTEQYPTAEPDIDDIFRRQMSSVERTVLVVDNALPAGLIEERGPRVLLGGNNDAGEFSAFDRAVQFIGSDIWRYDFVHFATSAFNTLYVSYLDRFNPSLLEAVTSRPVCVGHIDCYNEAVEIMGFRTQHWIRSCFFFLPPSEVRALGSFVTIRRGDGVFSGLAESPFRPDAPLSRRYQQYIIEWLTGRDIGQGVKWHSSLTPAGDTLPAFEHKAMTIMNEQLLGVRLRAMGCRLLDVTWLATELGRTGGAPVGTNWREQLANRDRDALVLSIDGTGPGRFDS
jgi:hypothetical protein